MSNYQTIRTIISQISGQENTIVTPKLFIKLTGDLTTATLLNQIVFYSDKSKRTDGYFYKSYKEWEEELCLTERQVRYSTKKLIKEGLVETSLKKANGAPTVHYKLDYNKLVESILTNCQNPSLQNVGIHSDKTSESLTENTTEITTENTTLKDTMSSDQKERSKDCIPYEDIISYLNEKAKKKYNHRTEGHKKHIRARWNEGYTVDDFKTVIDKKVEQWKDATGKGGKPLADYLRPSTLFGQKHFDNYLNESVKGGESDAKARTKGSFVNQYNF
ncbi:conserved phage C-terminal domain-containing protein [Bacillus thuringiensis]|uniref:Replication protein n=1 Tax=Bacillus thuringiensis TaxID=1428 RepID=A0A9X6TGG3_BACTU|nr:conserved phage C-terminal domain-containing protein [Bacillus thuringiensis]PEA85886.1 replication protein [Bacillus thuringiensis]